MATLIACILALGTACEAHSAELGGSPDRQGDRFNAAARRLEMPIRLIKNNCGQQVKRTCNYSVSGEMALMSASPPHQFDKTKEVALLFGKGSDAVKWIQATLTLISLYAPKADDEERRTIFQSLMRGLKDGEATATHGPVRFNLLKSEDIGLWLIVSIAD